MSDELTSNFKGKVEFQRHPLDEDLNISFKRVSEYCQAASFDIAPQRAFTRDNNLG